MTAAKGVYRTWIMNLCGPDSGNRWNEDARKDVCDNLTLLLRRVILDRPALIAGLIPSSAARSITARAHVEVDVEVFGGLLDTTLEDPSRRLSGEIVPG
jgi:hypothetical protein